MLLDALYEYGQKHPECSLPAGCTLKNAKAFINITADGRYVGISVREKGAAGIVCPSIFTKAQAAGTCDPFVVNVSIVLGQDGPEENPDKWRNKRPCYLSYWDALKEYNPDGCSVLTALTDDATIQQIASGLEENKIKSIDMVAFMVDGRSVANDERTLSFWQRGSAPTDSDKDKAHQKSPDLYGIDLITGEPCELAEVLHKTTGLSSVGGMGSGDSLACFDKDSFLSYGLRKSQVAPMGKQSSDLIVDALNSLIKTAPQVAGTKFVYWYKEEAPKAYDVLRALLGISTDEEANETSDDEDCEQDAIIQANAVFKSIESGEASGFTSLNNIYHILLLSAYSGRVMIRKYEEGSFAELVENTRAWYEDTSIVNSGGLGLSRHYKLVAMLLGIMEQPKSRQLYEQLGKEFAGVLPSVMDSITHGKQIPDSVVLKALQRIKSDMLSSNDGTDGAKGLPALNGRAIQWLIAYIRRTERKCEEEYTMSELNPSHPNPAYHCGRLLAIYGEIQQVASGRVGTTVVERFYSKMSSTPARVAETLDALSVHHLSKINSGLNQTLQEMLNEAYTSLGDKVPESLNMADRAYFALGYHQQLAAISKQKKEAAARKAYMPEPNDNN